MSSMVEFLANWVGVNFGVEALVEQLAKVPHDGVSKGKRQPTENPNVFLEEVSATGQSSSSIELGQIKWAHGPLEGAWGTTRSQAVLQYALPLAKDGNYPPILRRIQLDADIKLKPESAFNELKDFAPLYQMMMDPPYNGNKAGFCTAMGTRTVTKYNEFGTIDGVLYHELLHVALARTFAGQLQKVTLHNLSGRTYGTREAAQAGLLEVVNETWKDWRGLLLHDADFRDERFIWERECAFYIRQYEKL